MADDLHHEIADFLQQHFEAFQLADDGSSSSSSSIGAASSSKAANIRKHVQILALNHGISQMTLTGNDSNDDDNSNSNNDLSSLVLPILLRYVDAALTMEASADNKDAITRTLALVSALACAVSVTCRDFRAVETILERAQEFSEVLSEGLRSQGCILLGLLAVQLNGLLRQSPKLFQNEEEQRQDFVTEILSFLDRMEMALLPRLTDKSQSVRQCAIQAVGHLLTASSSLTPSKNPQKKGTRHKTMKDDEDTESEDEQEDDDASEDDEEENTEQTEEVNPALEALLWSMWHDPSVANRVEAIQAVPISVDTVDHIVARIRDVKEKVRVAALEVLQEKVNPQQDMTEEHFRDIIQHGLTERCDATKMATMKLICSKWMKEAKFDPVELLRMIGATVNDEECEKALKVVLSTVRSGDHSPIQKLSDPEIRSFCASVDKSMVHLKDSSTVFDEFQLFYTRVACSAAKETSDLSYAQKEEVLTKAAPDIPTLCDLFQKHLARLMESIEEGDQECEDQESFVCLQLLQLAKVAGLHEEGSRRHFANVMTKSLSNVGTPEELIEECVESLRAAHEDDENGFFNAISVVSAALMSSTDQDGNSVLDDEIVSEVTIRVLFIFSVVLENASSMLSSHELLDNMVKIILSAVSSSTKTIREFGIVCFGKLGFLSQENTVLAEFKPILLKVASNPSEALQCRGPALLALADWAMLYSDILQPHKFEDGRTVLLMDCVHTMMQHPNESIVAIASEAAAKLLFCGKVNDKKLMGRLLTVFLDPNRRKEKEDDVMDADDKAVGSPLRLEQLLSLFFPAFCFKSIENPSFMLDSIGDSLLIASGFSKTKKRPLVFPLVKIVQYVCSVVSHSQTAILEQESKATKNDLDIRISSSLQVAKFLVKQEDILTVTQRRALCKFLGGQEIDISTPNKRSLIILKGFVDDLAFIADSSSAKSLWPITELLQDVNGEIEGETGSNGDQEGSGAESSDSDTFTEHSEDQDDESDDAFSHNSTVEDVLMDSLATLTVHAKENPPKEAKTKTSRIPLSHNSTVEDVLMDSLATLTVHAKENPPKETKTKTSRIPLRSSTQSSVSILESLGRNLA